MVVVSGIDHNPRGASLKSLTSEERMGIHCVRGVSWTFGGLSPHESPHKLWGHNSDTNMAIYTHISDICTLKVSYIKCS